MGLKFQYSSFEPCSYFTFRESGGAAGAITTHIHGGLGVGEPDVLSKARVFPERRFGAWKVHEKSFAQVGMELPQEKDFSVKLTQEEFTKGLKPTPSPPGFWDFRRRRLSSDEIKLRRCELGELRWVATVSRPDICAIGTYRNTC